MELSLHCVPSVLDLMSLIALSLSVSLRLSVSLSLSLCSLSARVGHGEHWRHLRGAGLRSAGGHLHGGAGVHVDDEADARDGGEGGLSDMPLLSLSLSLPWCPAPRGVTCL